MKKLGIHRGLYVESLRRLRLATILLAAIPTAIMATVLLVVIMEAYKDLLHSYAVSYESFIEVYWFLPALPFIVPVILSAVLLSQQNKRCDSDFYHSLPLTKCELSVTWLAAIATASVFVVLSSSLVVFGIDLINPETYFESWSAVLLPVFGACLASLMVTTVLFLSYHISGNTVTALFAAAILIFAPHLITAAFSTAIAEQVSVVSAETLNTFQYVTLFWSYDSVITWLVTIAITVVCFLLGVLAANRRPSEVAGQAAVSKALQIILRLSLSFVVCLPALLIILEGWWADELIVWVCYVLAVVVYMLFELFTTKKAKNMLKSLPWLGVLAVMNVVAILVVNMMVSSINNFCPTADEIDSVSVTELVEFRYDESLSDNACVSATIFPIYQAIYNNSDCGDVKLTDAQSKNVVEAALESTLASFNGYTTEEYASFYDAYGIPPYRLKDYRIEVEIDTGLVTRTRLIWVTNSQLKKLLGAIDEIEPLPTTDYYGSTFKPRV